MNVLLIHPFIITNTPTLYLTEPVGLISLATYLETNSKTKKNISILDLYVLGYNKIKKEGEYYKIGLFDHDTIVNVVKVRSPDLIGITNNFTTFTKAVFEIADLLKVKFPKVPIVIGGAHATMDAENVLAKGCRADIVVRGEGEITFSELAERIENQESYYDLKGITYRKNGNIVSNSRRPLIPDINVLPIPDRKYIDQDTYSMINRKMYFLSKGKKVASIITSRGCPFNCTFCSSKVVWERKFRPRRPELVIKEMKRLITEYHIDEFLINDDQLYLDKKRIYAICNMLIEGKWKIHLNIASGSSVWLMDEELLKTLKKAGLYRITFPIETGSEKTLMYIKKPIDLKKAKETIKIANMIGLWTYGNIIIGFPYETHEDIQDTVNYVSKSGLDYVTYFLAKPYAGSGMYEDFKKEGLLGDSEISPTTMGEAGHDIVHMTRKELQELRNKVQKQYFYYSLSNYLNPVVFYKYIFPKINSKEGILYFIKAFKNTLNTLVIQPFIQKLFSFRYR